MDLAVCVEILDSARRYLRICNDLASSMSNIEFERTHSSATVILGKPKVDSNCLGMAQLAICISTPLVTKALQVQRIT